MVCTPQTETKCHADHTAVSTFLVNGRSINIINFPQMCAFKTNKLTN